MKQEYIQAIKQQIESVDNLALLDLILQLTRKAGAVND